MWMNNAKDFGWLGGGGVSESVPTPGFQADLTSSITPEIGTGGTLTRATARNYWSAAGTLSQVTSGNPAIPAFQSDIDTGTGIYLGGPTTNYILQSEAPATTWTVVGTATPTNSVGTWFGSVTYGTLAAAAIGDGLTQTAAITSASRVIVFSFWAQGVTNPITTRFTIEGSSGGTPQTSTQDVVITPNEPARYYFRKTFTGAATGNVKVSVTLRETGTINIAGMMVEDKESSGGITDQVTLIPGPYIKTTSAAVAHNGDHLAYTASNISNTSAWTFSMWVNTDYSGFGSLTPYADLNATGGVGDKYFFLVRDTGGLDVAALGTASSTSAIRMYVNGGSFDTAIERHHRWRWTHYVATGDYTTDQWKIYKNGSLFASDTTVRTAPAAANLFAVGSFTSGSYRTLSGVISRFKYWPQVLSASQVSQVYQAEATFYHEATYELGWPKAPNWMNPYNTVFFDFAEASGSIVDETQGLTLTASGSPTYGVTGTGRFANLTGITYGTSKEHQKLSATTDFSWDGNTDNMHLEIWFSKTSTSGVQYLTSFNGHGSTTDYMFALRFDDDTTLTYISQNDIGQTETGSWTLANSLVDGSIHKLRVRFGKNTSVTLHIDEVRHATEHTDDVLNSTVSTNTGIRIPGAYDGSGANLIGTVYGWRWTKSTSDPSVVLVSTGGPMSQGSE